MKNLSGEIVPAGVIIIGTIFRAAATALITEQYPAKFDCELSTSIFCAIVLLGIISKLAAVTPASAKAFISGFSLNGSRRLKWNDPRFRPIT